MLRLLFRFYEPDSGMLSVAGRSITDYTMKSLRAKIGEVGPTSALSLLASSATHNKLERLACAVEAP